MVRVWVKLAYRVGRALARLGLSPGTVTFAGVAFSVAAAAAAWLGGWWLFVAAGLVFLAALADSADGAVALITVRTTRLGAFYDSIADRVSEAAWLLALWIAGVPTALVIAGGALAWLHEYARARATVCGMPDIGVVTWGERPTRVIVIIGAFTLGGAGATIDPRLGAGVATVVVSAWIVLGILGLARLFGAVRASLSPPH